MAHTAKKTAFLSTIAIMLGALYLSPAQASERGHHQYKGHSGERNYGHHQYKGHHGYSKPARYYVRPAHHRHHPDWKHRYYRSYTTYNYYPGSSYGVIYSGPGYRVVIDYGY